MLFNTLEYFLFLPITFFLYWAIKETKYQNIFILISSYVFYGWWDWRFLFLIFLSTVVDSQDYDNQTSGTIIRKIWENYSQGGTIFMALKDGQIL